MPRKPRFMHPLRVVRTTIGLTQPQFAAKVGVAEVTIRKIENGGLNMSLDLAQRIRLFTGADSAELLKGKTGKALGSGGAPYTKGTFEYWKKTFFVSSKKNAIKYFNDSNGWLQVLLLASAQPTVGKLPAVYMSFLEWLEKTKAEFKLDKQVDALLNQLDFIETRTFTYEFIRNKNAQPFVKYYGLKNDPRKKASDTVTVKAKQFPMWSTSGPCPDLYRLIKD